MDIARREFIRLTVGLALTSLGGRAGANGAAALSPNGDGKILSDVVYQLFPHERLNKDVYEQVTEQLNARISQSGELAAMLDSAMEVLAGNSHEKWFALPEREKTLALEKIQHTPFFQFVLNETLGGVYRHPLTWELLGYEGSSLEFGGYIDRGFNDIDWLPD
ncbi:MAG: hypothetical protein OXI88_03765 [Gammaproteobacteria bacterium]|nr:hypothetical protein [Gammaproteobacteria bacterium]